MRIAYAGRKASASPSTGFAGKSSRGFLRPFLSLEVVRQALTHVSLLHLSVVHASEQAALIDEALDLASVI